VTHEQLVARAGRWLKNSKRCLWVLTESKAGFCYKETADAIGWDRYGLSYLIECKTDRQDFMRDRRKEFRRIPSLGMGYFRYYLVPKSLVIPGEKLPPSWGLMVLRGDRVSIEVEALMQPRNADVEISLLIHHPEILKEVADGSANKGVHQS
jgi:hypothetical protein